MKDEGKQVRQAYDGPTVEHDKLIGQIERQSSDEYARASDASESGARLKNFLEDTGLNSQAFSWLKAIMKKLPKKDGQHKAMDIIRSLEVGLPMVKAHVAGQGTSEMNLDTEEPIDDDTDVPGPDDDLDAETEEFNQAVDDLETVQPFEAA